MKGTRFEYDDGFAAAIPRWFRRIELWGRMDLQDWLFVVVLFVLVGLGGTYGASVLLETDPYAVALDRDGP